MQHLSTKLIELITISQKKSMFPSFNKESAIHFLNKTLGLLYPGLTTYKLRKDLSAEKSMIEACEQLVEILNTLEEKDKFRPPEIIVDAFAEHLLIAREELDRDCHYILDSDPAAQSKEEVIVCYPGFFALAVYRLAHFFYLKEIPLLPRVLSEYAHQLTGIDIHPGAKINSPVHIDHGTGVVIGESTTIEKNVKIYQGVTLGALSVSKDTNGQKRHPTIRQGVTIYAHATVLGGETEIGENSTLGGNVWVTKSISKNTFVYVDFQSRVQSRIKNVKSS